MTTSVEAVYCGSEVLIIFLTDSNKEVIPADNTMTAMMIALKY